MIHSPFSKTKQIPLGKLRGICLKQSRPKLRTFQCCQIVCAIFSFDQRLFSIKQKVSMWAFAAILDASRRIRVYPTNVIRSHVYRQMDHKTLWTHLYLVLTTSAVNLRQMLIPDVCRAIVFAASHSHIALRRYHRVSRKDREA